MPTDEPKSNVVPLDRGHTLTLNMGDRLPFEDYPDHVFMLRSGSIALEAYLSFAQGPVKKRIALLDQPYDLFGPERQALSGHANAIQYVALEASRIVAIPNGALSRMLAKPADREHTIGERVLQLQAQQMFRLMATVISAFHREDGASNREHFALQQVASSVKDARREEREARAKSEQQIEENKKAIIDQLVQEKTELEIQLEAERAKFAKLEREHRELQAYTDTVCAEFRETTGAFHAWIAKQHQDSEEFVRLLNMFQAAQGLHELTHEDIFGVMSGRGLHPEVGFTPEEIPTAQSPIEERIPAPAPRASQPVVISERIRAPEAPTRREGPPRPRMPMQTLTGLGGVASSAAAITQQMKAGTMVPGRALGREPTVEFDLNEMDLVEVEDDSSPQTLATPVYTPPPPPQSSGLDEEREEDDEGNPIRSTLVGFGPLTPDVPDDQLPPEFRKGYGRNS